MALTRAATAIMRMKIFPADEPGEREEIPGEGNLADQAWRDQVSVVEMPSRIGVARTKRMTVLSIGRGVRRRLTLAIRADVPARLAAPDRSGRPCAPARRLGIQRLGLFGRAAIRRSGFDALASRGCPGPGAASGMGFPPRAWPSTRPAPRLPPPPRSGRPDRGPAQPMSAGGLGPELERKYLFYLGDELRDPFAGILRVEGLNREEAAVAPLVDQAL